MKLRCRLGRHDLRPYSVKADDADEITFVLYECSRCGVRKARKPKDLLP